MKPRTEAEAAKLWCPFARAPDGHNRDGDGNVHRAATCIGRRCMAWQPISPSHGGRVDVGPLGVCAAVPG